MEGQEGNGNKRMRESPSTSSNAAKKQLLMAKNQEQQPDANGTSSTNGEQELNVVVTDQDGPENTQVLADRDIVDNPQLEMLQAVIAEVVSGDPNVSAQPQEEPVVASPESLRDVPPILADRDVVDNPQWEMLQAVIAVVVSGDPNVSSHPQEEPVIAVVVSGDPNVSSQPQEEPVIAEVVSGDPNVSSQPQEEPVIAEVVSGDPNISFHPQEEPVVASPESLRDVPPIEISSDESDTDDADEDMGRNRHANRRHNMSGNTVVTISDSEEDQNESNTSDEQTESTSSEELTESLTSDEQNESPYTEESPSSEEQNESPSNEEQRESGDNETGEIDLTIWENRRKLQSLTDLRPRVRLSREMAAQAHNFEMLHLIGSGAFGKVFVVRKLAGYDSGRLYAMKAIAKIGAIHSWETAKHVRVERQILEIIQGAPFVVSLHYAFQDSRYLYLVTNLAQGGEMYRRIQTFVSLPQQEVCLYIAEVVVALEYLHDNNILYRDLKLENILIDSEGHIILADLGLATILTAEKQYRAHGFCGTLEYMAPEVLQLKPEGYGKPVDLWGLGVVLVEMIAGVSPFVNTTLAIDQQKAETERLILYEKPKIPSWTCPVAINLIMKLLEKDPNERIDADGIRQHPFFRVIDWEKVRKRAYRMFYQPRLNATDDVQHFDPEFTNQEAVLPDVEPPPWDLQLYKDYEYTSPEILDWARLFLDEGEEYRNPYVEQSMSPRPDELNQLSNQICSGNFGTCFLTKHNCLVKIIHASKFHISEVDAMMSLFHPNIVQFYGHCRNRTEVWIYMEYLRGQDLMWWIQNNLLNEYKSRDIILQVALALFYMHGKHFIHGDLKPQNVVCADSNLLIFKLVDFGNARYSSSFTQWQARARYSLDYAPPELITNHNGSFVTYSPAVDIYSLGATLYCMVVGHPPFRYYEDDVWDSPETRELLMNDITGAPFNQSSEKWLSASQEFRDLVTACLQKNPADRPKIFDVITSEWMQQRRVYHEQPTEGAGLLAIQGFPDNVGHDEVQGDQEQVQEVAAAPRVITRRYSVA